MSPHFLEAEEITELRLLPNKAVSGNGAAAFLLHFGRSGRTVPEQIR
jgi:hypothetical protein